MIASGHLLSCHWDQLMHTSYEDFPFAHASRVIDLPESLFSIMIRDRCTVVIAVHIVIMSQSSTLLHHQPHVTCPSVPNAPR